MRRKQPIQEEHHADDVVLRRWRKGGGLIALFPEELVTIDGLVTACQHVGQHGVADYPLRYRQDRSGAGG